MAKFIIYSYKLHLTSDSQIAPLYPEEQLITPEEALVNKQEIFQQIIDEHINGEKPFLIRRRVSSKKDSEWKEYESQILWSQGQITLLQIANKRSRIKHEGFKKKPDEDSPWCNVVIDNRHDIQHIAIQKSEAFTKTDTVASILQESFNSRLHGYHLETDIDAMYQSSAFWSVISRYRLAGIQMIQFDFAFPNLAWASDMLDKLNAGAKDLGARPSAKFTAPKGGRLNIDCENKNEDIKAMTNVCTGTGADILVKPATKDALIHCRDDKELRVQQQLPDEVLERAEEKDMFNSIYDHFVTFTNNIQLFYE